MTKKGQSIVEYALIAILVILGIAFMGTYVLRSINAHYKLWDEGVHDAFEENLNQAPINDMPFIATNCQCNPTPENCGASTGTLCGATQREVDYSCNIPGCNGAQGNAECVNDPTCCSTATPQGCGSAPLPAGDTSADGNIGIGTTCPSGPSGSTCYQSLPSATGSPCYYGQELWGSQCGSGYPTVCVPDTTDCTLPECKGFALFPDSIIYCENQSNQAPTAGSIGLTQNTPITYVGNSSASCPKTGATCQVYCVPPYVVNSSNSACVLQFYVAATTCDAATNFTSGSGCSASCDGSTTSCHVCKCTATSNACGGGCTVTTNDESFTMCAATSTVITSVSLMPDGIAAPDTVTNASGKVIPAVNGGCGDPGEPTQECDASIGF